jgi:hypothetical protein
MRPYRVLLRGQGVFLPPGPRRIASPVWPDLICDRHRRQLFEESPLSDVTPHVLRHSFASIANDLGFTEVTIAALVGHAKGSVTSKYIHTLDTALIMAADTISGYIQGLLDGIEFKQTAYALDRDSRKAALARFLKRASGSEQEAAEKERRLAA